MFGRKEKLNENMYIVVGLGNFGKEYENTRHNVGFDAIDILANNLNISVNKNKFDALCGNGHYNDKKIMLMKPLTYMNLSGRAVAFACNFYKIPLNHSLIIIYDDTALPLGNIRIRKNGSSGGHNGMKSIIEALMGDNFIRIRVGIGEKTSDDLANYVLGKFSSDDRKVIDKSLKDVAEAVKCIIKSGIDIAMNKYNTSRSNKQKEDI